MKDKEIRAKLKQEFESAVPDVLDKVMDSEYGTQPALISHPVRRSYMKRILAFSCMLFILSFGIGFNNVYFQAFASISIDINPSVGLNLNRFDKVVGVKAYNSEAEVVIKDLNLLNASSDNAVSAVLLSAMEKGYITSSENTVLLSVWSESEAERYEKSLQDNVEKCMRSNNIKSEIRFENIDTITYHNAQSANMSCGRAGLIAEIMKYGSSLEENELLKKSVRELFEVYDNCRNPQSQGLGGMGNHHNPPDTNGSTAVPDQERSMRHHGQNGRGRRMHN